MAKKITLYHGTTKENYEKIKVDGLKLPNRKYHNYIYFTENVDYAKKKGEVLLIVRIPEIIFYESFCYVEDNGGYLRSYPVSTIDVPKELIKEVKE